MKKFNKFLLFAVVLSLVLTLFLVTACNEDDDTDREWTLDINFETNTDQSIEDMEITFDEDTEEIDLPSIPTRAGYTFEGWYLDSDFETELTIANLIDTLEDTNDITFYAKWSPNINTLNFDANGGEGSMDSLIAETDETITLPSNEFTLESHAFTGWALSDEGDVVYEDEDDYTMGTDSEYTLYAQWIDISQPAYTVDGDYILFGEYPQTLATSTELENMSDDENSEGYYISGDDRFKEYQNNFYKVEPIRWRVLEQDDGTALLFSEMVLDNLPFHTPVDGPPNTNWETSDIRAWLNDDFYNMVFEHQQKQIIQASTIESEHYNWDDPGVLQTSITTDNLFYLSFDEIHNSDYGFGEPAGRIASASDFATDKGVSIGSGARYGLRTGIIAERADRIDVLREHDSGGTTMGTNSSDPSGVRPAIVIELED
ncbi:MAG: InlB B-repeat-containing protein [Bacillota bacterium]